MTTSRNSSLKANKSTKHINADLKYGMGCALKTSKGGKRGIAFSKGKEDPPIISQHPQKALKKTNMDGYRIQCWAHTKKGSRCTMMVSSREGEPVPVPYCKVHMKSGDGALKVVKHPIAGKCLVAR